MRRCHIQNVCHQTQVQGQKECPGKFRQVCWDGQYADQTVLWCLKTVIPRDLRPMLPRRIHLYTLFSRNKVKRIVPKPKTSLLGEYSILSLQPTGSLIKPSFVFSKEMPFPFLLLHLPLPLFPVTLNALGENQSNQSKGGSIEGYGSSVTAVV